MKPTTAAFRAIPVFLLVSLFNITLASSSNTFVDEIDCTKKEESCFGNRTWKDGKKYKGEFNFGIPHGIGKMTWKNGSTYEGEFKDGFRHGEGFQLNDDGSKYKGNFVNGYMHGEGVYSFPCGHNYVGAFYKDKMQGLGTISFINGTSYTGKWKNGKPNGEGVFQRKDGSEFKGLFKNGIREGNGEVVHQNTTLKGEWKKNTIDGPSTFQFANGDQLNCEWKKGKVIKESCEYICKDGTVKKAALDQLAANKTLTQNIAFALYVDGVEKIANQDKQNAKLKLIIAKNMTSKNNALYKSIQTQLEIIAE